MAQEAESVAIASLAIVPAVTIAAVLEKAHALENIIRESDSIWFDGRDAALIKSIVVDLTDFIS